jgi:hypothetical protein
MFKWQIWPSFNKGYTVFIDRTDNNGFMLINEDGTSRFTKRKVSKKDCDRLNDVLETYEFPHKPSSLLGSVSREYYDTKVQSDTSWVIIDSDTIRRSLAWAHGYFYDRDSAKYYTEQRKVDACSDGILYEGECLRNGIKKTFSVHSCYLSSSDYKLNLLVCDLMIKYNRNNYFIWLRQVIDSDRPGN